MKTFEELQAGLGQVWELNKPGSTTDHVMVVFPSFGLGETMLSHYAARLPALEHRYLVPHLLLHRIPGCRMVYLGTEAPGEEVLAYYTSLVPAQHHASVRSRFTVVSLPDDHTPRSIARKLLDRLDVLESVRSSFGGRPAFIEPWNVTRDEVEVALRLDAPINGTSPDLWPLGFKSSGRRIFREAGVPTPLGREDVRTVDDVLAAAALIRTEHPEAAGFVIKHDNSASGDGNAVVRFDSSEQTLRQRIEALPEWYLRDLKLGGIVEELIAGSEFASPSAQLDITPFGEPRVLATHEQVLGGVDGQVYMGCRFPADSAYAARLAEYGRAIGSKLAARGVVGRFSIDFVVARNARREWMVFALEVNLRKGGTTHPYAALRNVAPGRYDLETGTWIVQDGSVRFYCSTDNLVDDAWLGLPPTTVIEAIRNAGLEYSYVVGTGVVLHMLSCLAIDGRFGLTAIGRTPEHAAEIYHAVRPALARAAEAY